LFFFVCFLSSGHSRFSINTPPVLRQKKRERVLELENEPLLAKKRPPTAMKNEYVEQQQTVIDLEVDSSPSSSPVPSKSSTSSQWWQTAFTRKTQGTLRSSDEYAAIDEAQMEIGTRWWNWYFLVDWVLILGLLVTELIVTTFFLSPYDRYLPPNDPTVSYPLLDDIVPTWSLAFVDVLGPIVIFLFLQIWMRSGHDFHHACLGLLQALVFTMIFTDSIKFAAGRYRPDYLARVSSNSSASVLRDGRQSFPSGHSSVSFAAMVYLSLYLAGKLGLYRRYGGSAWKAIVCLFPLAVATTVAVSRVRDYHHDFSDILAGSLLGAGMGIMAYFMNYNAITAENSHMPKLRADTTIMYTLPISRRG
jgi:diacylglycerol diphosphate phosphatase/phosphatidate phosphatase